MLTPPRTWTGRRVKPRLHRNKLNPSEWVCYGADIIGWGMTPDAAYELWLRRFRRAHG